jgi:hypothetical protein
MELTFKKPPRITNRSDTLELLDQLPNAESTRGLDKVLLALKESIEREII